MDEGVHFMEVLLALAYIERASGVASLGIAARYVKSIKTWSPRAFPSLYADTTGEADADALELERALNALQPTVALMKRLLKEADRDGQDNS